MGKSLILETSVGGTIPDNFIMETEIDELGVALTELYPVGKLRLMAKPMMPVQAWAG